MLERQRPQQHGVDDAEDGGIGADAERERQHRDGGEAGRAAQTSDRVPHVVSDVLQPPERSRVAMQVLRQRHAAHRAPRGQARLVRRQSAAAMLVFEQREMRRHLAIEIRVGAIRRKTLSNRRMNRRMPSQVRLKAKYRSTVRK